MVSSAAARCFCLARAHAGLGPLPLPGLQQRLAAGTPRSATATPSPRAGTPGRGQAAAAARGGAGPGPARPCRGAGRADLRCGRVAALLCPSGSPACSSFRRGGCARSALPGARPGLRGCSCGAGPGERAEGKAGRWVPGRATQRQAEAKRGEASGPRRRGSRRKSSAPASRPLSLLWPRCHGGGRAGDRRRPAGPR